MKVIAFTKYSRLGASSRLRTYQYVPKLKEFGIDCDIFPLFDDSYMVLLNQGKKGTLLYYAGRYAKRVLQLLKIPSYDAVWIEKELFPYFSASIERLLSRLNIKIFVDYDDAIFVNYETSQRWFIRCNSQKIARVMEAATGVICGNRFLADYCLNANQSNIAIIPTSVDINRYCLSEKATEMPTVIGWIGSPSTVKYLEMLMPIFSRLWERYDFNLHVIGGKFDSLAGDRVQFIPWSESTEVALISQFDIGIMPLACSRWELGKCGYKLIQYMAAGVVPVGTKWGANCDIIDHGSNGFLASDEDEWLAILGELIANPIKRKEVSCNARSAAKRHYSIQSNAQRIAEMLGV